MTTYVFVNAMKQPHKFVYINVGMSDSTLLDFTRQSPYFHIQNHSNYSLMTPLSCTIVLNHQNLWWQMWYICIVQVSILSFPSALICRAEYYRCKSRNAALTEGVVGWCQNTSSSRDLISHCRICREFAQKKFELVVDALWRITETSKSLQTRVYLCDIYHINVEMIP